MDNLLNPPVPVRPRQKAGLTSEEMADRDEVIWVEEATGSTYALNLTASAILDLCDGSRSVGEIAALIGETLPGAAQQIEHDLRPILAEFVAYGLIVDGDGVA